MMLCKAVSFGSSLSLGFIGCSEQAEGRAEGEEGVAGVVALTWKDPVHEYWGEPMGLVTDSKWGRENIKQNQNCQEMEASWLKCQLHWPHLSHSSSLYNKHKKKRTRLTLRGMDLDWAFKVQMNFLSYKITRNPFFSRCEGLPMSAPLYSTVSSGGRHSLRYRWRQ